ncbi:hypothetical protein CHARACLAT_026283 [Characodon lateralis]|uniref:Uncharacterized protein n=1 Tax=Characodon lateralis TaxID=208331 RepID=A0ABU7DUB0_9TELE|nr:hypothetical protein [Characodon lateralis]
MFNFQKANDPMLIVYNPTLHNLPTNPYSALEGSHLFSLCNIIFLKESDLNNETFQNLKNKSYAASTAQSLLGSDYKSLPRSASVAFVKISSIKVVSVTAYQSLNHSLNHISVLSLPVR